MFQIFWNVFYHIFRCFRQPETVKINNDDIEYGKLPDCELTNNAKLTIKVPKYEFIFD